ncbi:hypothetical protein [Yoonia maritima]|uniref:hypothetical protein n=1 Tax=Yoonia maritima TaxID=1435347 RepID=UPI0013A63FD6|nr:hypothetical protein [Yoonia maritima]
MPQDHYQDFLKYERLGLRDEAQKSVLLFVKSVSSFADKEIWTHANLLSVERNRSFQIRHEIYDVIAYPVLLEGYKRDDPECLYLMGMTFQNLIYYMKQPLGISWCDREDLLKRAYFSEPSSGKYRTALLSALMDKFRDCDHEWPVGILGDVFPFSELKQDIVLALKLDKRSQCADRISEFSDRVDQYIERIQTRRSDKLDKTD